MYEVHNTDALHLGHQGFGVQLKITLKNVKYAAFASEETSCFEASIYIDGKKAGTASNDGHGGSTHIDPHSLRKVLQKESDSLPDVVTDMDDKTTGEKFKYRPDAESIIDDLLAEHLTEKDLIKALKKRVLFIRGDKMMETRAYSASELTLLLARKNLNTLLSADKILNLMPFAEALVHYKNFNG